MAFEHNGTFTVSQLERWKTYVRNQLELVDARISHLESERDRIGNLAFAFDAGGVPTSLTEDSPTTYCGKLYAAYVALGGDAEFDLQVRSTTQPVFRQEADETTDSQLMSNGEIIGVKGLSDEESAVLMQDSRNWVQGDLYRRRDYLERKIRRALDYGEQLTAEISELRTIKGSAQVENSLEFILQELDSLASDKRYFAITDDSSNPDPHGKLAKAPVAAYQGATPTSIQRTYNGVVRPQDLMSFDRQIDQVCPHAVTEEALFVSSDRQTVRPLRPITASSSVSLRLNNELEVPSIGSYLAAKSSGTRRGPFSVTSGVDNLIELVVDQGDTQSYTIPSISKMAPERVAALLNNQFMGIVFSVVNDRIAFATRDKGPEKSILIKSTSTAASVFGFTVNQEFRGQRLAPGWTVISDVNTLPDRPTRLIVFDDPLRSSSDFVEISYVTQLEECRRCGGTGRENDWRYNIHGELVVVRDEALLLQELQKNFYTIRGTNPFHTWYGTQLLESVGKKISASGFAKNLVVSDIYQSFNRWQEIKRRQEERVGQFVSDREFPFQLLSVNLEESEEDPTVIFVSITVQNRSNDPIQLTRGLKVPAYLEESLGSIRQSIRNTVLTG